MNAAVRLNVFVAFLPLLLSAFVYFPLVLPSLLSFSFVILFILYILSSVCFFRTSLLVPLPSFHHSVLHLFFCLLVCSSLTSFFASILHFFLLSSDPVFTLFLPCSLHSFQLSPLSSPLSICLWFFRGFKIIKNYYCPFFDC